ncbi:hypothetical protein NQZ68_037143 [Dissostichus eleginoides]|nr:hypothetical protein NQZ68_037143 [Dissostichus eleginoides]
MFSHSRSKVMSMSDVLLSSVLCLCSRSGAGNNWGLVRDDLASLPGEVGAETT